jgi:hypothetical protein
MLGKAFADFLPMGSVEECRASLGWADEGVRPYVVRGDHTVVESRSHVMKYDPEKLLFVVDLAGTLRFAIEGATAAISGNLDLLGLMVLAFATALGGGIIRDLLIGAVPPSSLRDWRYSAVVFAGAAVVFFLHRFVQGIPNGIMIILDAAALALFAVAGTQKALIYKSSLHRDSAGDYYSCGWGHDSRCVSGPDSYGLAC